MDNIFGLTFTQSLRARRFVWTEREQDADLELQSYADGKCLGVLPFWLFVCNAVALQVQYGCIGWSCCDTHSNGISRPSVW